MGSSQNHIMVKWIDGGNGICNNFCYGFQEWYHVTAWKHIQKKITSYHSTFKITQYAALCIVTPCTSQDNIFQKIIQIDFSKMFPKAFIKVLQTPLRQSIHVTICIYKMIPSISNMTCIILHFLRSKNAFRKNHHTQFLNHNCKGLILGCQVQNFCILLL